jgi:hypothetical protein
MIIGLDDLPKEPFVALPAYARRAAERPGLDLDVYARIERVEEGP